MVNKRVKLKGDDLENEGQRGIENGTTEDARGRPSAAIGGDWRAQRRTEVADIEVATSNSVFETLEEWNTYLKSENNKRDHKVRPHAGPMRRGPSI